MSNVTHLGGRARRPAQDTPPGPLPPRPGLVLSASQADDLEHAERFVLELDDRMRGASAPYLAYLCGLAEGHVLNLCEALRSVAR